MIKIVLQGKKDDQYETRTVLYSEEMHRQAAECRWFRLTLINYSKIENTKLPSRDQKVEQSSYKIYMQPTTVRDECRVANPQLAAIVPLEKI